MVPKLSFANISSKSTNYLWHPRCIYIFDHLLYVLGSNPPSTAFMCRVCMFSSSLCRFFLDTLAYSHSPQLVVLGSTGDSKRAIGVNVIIGASLCW